MIKKWIYKWAVRQTIKKLTEEKYKTNSMFYSWQSNIAMIFKDHYHEKMRNRNLPLNNIEIHQVANDAARDFLNLLIESK